VLVWADPATGREVRRVEPGPLAADIRGPVYDTKLSVCLDPRAGRPAVFGMFPSADGRKLLAWRDEVSGELLVHRASSGKGVDRFAAVSSNGQLIARETSDLPGDGIGVELSEVLGRQSVVLEDALTGSRLLALQQPDYLQTDSTTFTPDGHSVVTWTSTYPENGRLPGVTTVRLWEVRTGRQRLAFSLPVIGKWWEFEPQASAMSPDGRFLAAARPDKTLSVWDLTTGKELAKWSGYGTIVTCLAFRPDGKALASGHGDGTALIWDLSGLTPAKPAVIDREAAWRDLASDAEKAYGAILSLSADPEGARFLRDRVKPAALVSADAVRKLIADLDSTDFATRERATAELAKLGDAADVHLQSALKEDLSAEQRQRIKELLDRRGLVEPDPDRLRALRCVEVLERAGTAEAIDILRTLAKGAPGARLTREADDALKRLVP
jgi:hypothetical protein